MTLRPIVLFSLAVIALTPVASLYDAVMPATALLCILSAGIVECVPRSWLV